jgi:hypothetical protein
VARRLQPNKLLRLGFAGPSGLPGKLFGEFQGVDGVFVGLFAEFVSSQMISLAVSNGSGGVGVGRKVMEFCESIVGALGHWSSPTFQNIKPRF